MIKISKIIFAGLFASLGLNLSAQNYFVSTEPSGKVAVLEEFTGINCTYCPDGHKRSDQLKKMYKDKYIAINIHQGNFAGTLSNGGTYKTPFGDSIAFQTGLGGYPSGSLNRTVFVSSETAMDRNAWATYVPQVIAETACVNLAAESYLNWETRELICIVQGYYTSDSKERTNYLNVAILQDDILGPQTGSNAYPDMVVNGEYRHNHMLRHLLTGQWGTPIANTKSGNYFSDTIRYILPQEYGKIPLKMGDIGIVAFVTETRQVILNACESSIDIKGVASNPRLISAKQAEVQNCDGLVAVEAEIKNVGEARINTVSFEYTYNNETYQYTSEAPYILPRKTAIVQLSTFPLVESVNDVSLKITAVNGEPLPTTVPADSIVGKAQILKKVGRSEKTESLKLELNLDQYASEVSWRIMNSKGEEVISKEYTDDLGSDGTKLYTEIVPINYWDCYLFEIFDAGKDGINSDFGKGYYKIYDDKNNILAQSDGKYGEKDYQILSIGTLANEGIHSGTENKLHIYPNPTQGQGKCIFSLEKSSSVQLSLYDLSGRKIRTISNAVYTAGTHQIDFDFGSLAPALYIIHLQSSEGMQTQKVNITK